MYWFSRPPYVRYAIAAAIVMGAMWGELGPTTTNLHPFAVRDLSAGNTLESGDIRWEPVPAGFLPTVEAEGVLGRAVAEGDPILPSTLATSTSEIPDEWWTLEIDLPAGVVPGQAVRLVVLPDPGLPPPAPIPAIVAASGSPTGALSSGGNRGRIAVPPESASAAAIAVSTDRVTVLIGGLG